MSARIEGGPDEGTFATLEADVATRTPVAELKVGDDIVLNDAGPDVDAAARYSFADVQRRAPLVILAVVFGVAVVVLGRLRGLLALAGIGVTVGVPLAYVFPALLEGASPLGVALTGAVVIAVGTIYLAHGISDHTTVALLGTIASLPLTAALGASFGAAAHLSGLASEELLNLLSFAPELDSRGLLLAATIINALGVLDDVTITQVSAVWELHASDPRVGARGLYSAGIRIGRDHIASRSTRWSWPTPPRRCRRCCCSASRASPWGRSLPPRPWRSRSSRPWSGPSAWLPRYLSPRHWPAGSSPSRVVKRSRPGSARHPVRPAWPNSRRHILGILSAVRLTRVQPAFGRTRSRHLGTPKQVCTAPREVPSISVTRLGRGELEKQVLDVLWAAEGPMTPRQVQDQVGKGRKLAYTTTMTILVRLHKKGLVERQPAGRTFAYRPRVSRDQRAAERMNDALTSAGDAALALTHFVESLPADQVHELRAVLRRARSDR